MKNRSSLPASKGARTTSGASEVAEVRPRRQGAPFQASPDHGVYMNEVPSVAAISVPQRSHKVAVPAAPWS